VAPAPRLTGLVPTADSDIDRAVLPEVAMVGAARRAKLLRELEQEFIPDYDAHNMPAADKRAASALEHIAFRVGRIEKNLAGIAAAIEAVLPKA
jgi:hypothetical protein